MSKHLIIWGSSLVIASSTNIWGQLFIDGLCAGLVFIILACGLVLIVSTSRILFMTYGIFYTIGAYMTYYGISWFHLPYFASLLFGIVISAIIAIVSYFTIFKRFQFVPGSFLATMVASYGLLMILYQGGLLVFGTVPRSIPPIIEGIINLLGIMIIIDKLLLIALSLLTMGVLFWLYEKTNLGVAMRAFAYNPDVASLMGINRNMIAALALGLGCALAGFAGGILAPTYGMNATMGNNVMWTVILIIMLGGMDSLVGAAVGAIIIGMIYSFGQYFIGGTIQIYTFLIIGITLYFRPSGLFGRGTLIDI